MTSLVDSETGIDISSIIDSLTSELSTVTGLVPSLPVKRDSLSDIISEVEAEILSLTGIDVSTELSTIESEVSTIESGTAIPVDVDSELASIESFVLSETGIDISSILAKVTAAITEVSGAVPSLPTV